MSAAPVAERERIQSLDVMRGFAVLGILAVNAMYFAAPWQAALNPGLEPWAVNDENLWAWFVMHVFFEFKCITLFSILFGASIYLVGGERSDAERGVVLRRRLLWLLLFGLIHGVLIWSGDVLLTYALTGLLVMLARSWRARTLLIVGVVLLVVSLGLMGLFGLFIDYIPAGKLAEIEAQIWRLPDEEVARIIAAYQGGIASATLENINAWTQFLASGLPVMLVRTAGVMMIGMALFKWGFLSARAPVWVYLLFLALGACAFAAIGAQALIDYRGGFDFVHMQSVGILPNAWLAIFGSLFYASLFALLVKLGALKPLTGVLSAVGRMAFTNYITQSLIMTTLFWGGRGFGLFGEFSREQLWGVVAAIWTLQLIWSPLWLTRFEMGPLEWMWRRLSYGRAVPFVRSVPA